TSLRFIKQPLSFESPDFLQGFDLTESAVLFANVLGQIEVKSETRLQESLRTVLQQVPWASYHDRFSCDQVAWTYPEGEVGRVWTTDELIPEVSPRQFRKAPEVQEHLASDALS